MCTSFRSVAATLLPALALLALFATPVPVQAQTAGGDPGTGLEHSPDMDPNGTTALHSPDMDPDGTPSVVFDEHSPDMDPNGLQAEPSDPSFRGGYWLRSVIARVLLL